MNKNEIKLNWLTVALLLIYYGICASLYPSLPDKLPVHWGINGEVNRYADKVVVDLIMPLLPLVIYLFMTVVPKIDPRRENYYKFGSSYQKIRLAIVAILVCFNTIPLLIGLGYRIDVSLVSRIIIPILSIVLGNYMGKIRYNYFTGIRTPWTLSNETVWNKTHRLTGKLMVIGGFISLVGLITPSKVGFIIVIAGIVVPTIIGSIYSYIIYTKLRLN